MDRCTCGKFLLAIVFTTVLACTGEGAIDLEVYTSRDEIVGSLPNNVKGVTAFDREALLPQFRGLEREGFNGSFDSGVTTLDFDQFTVSTNKRLHKSLDSSFEGGSGLRKSGEFTSDPFDFVEFSLKKPTHLFGITISDFGDFVGEELRVRVHEFDILLTTANSDVPIDAFSIAIHSRNPFEKITLLNSSWSDSVSYDEAFAATSRRIAVNPVIPEPTSWTLFSFGTFCIGLRKRFAKGFLRRI